MVRRFVLLGWLLAELVLLGSMIATLVLGHPQGLALIFLMIIVAMMAGQTLEEETHRRDRKSQ